MKKKVSIQNKFINHLIKNGEKKTSEKILLKSFKVLQKNSLKKSQKICQLALIHSIPIFKLHQIKNKKLKKRKKWKIKEIPGFISNSQSKISLTIKVILRNMKRKKNLKFYHELKKEILLSITDKSSSTQTRNELQKYILTKKHYFWHYRWN